MGESVSRNRSNWGIQESQPYIPMKTFQALFLLATLFAPFASHAQFEACPGGVQVGQQCGGGVCQPICQYDQGSTQARQAPRVIVKREIWEDRWGAIAVDGKGKMGVSTNEESDREAEHSARIDCVSRGGDEEACMTRRIRTVYKNQCVAYAWGAGVGMTQARPTLEQAEQAALEACSADVGQPCDLIYSDCSEAVFLGYE